MAIAIDSQESASAGHNSATSPLTWSFNNAAGNWLIVGVVVSNAGVTPPTIGAVTYNGVAMSLITGSSNNLVSASSSVIALFSLQNPAVGSNTLSVSFSGPGGALDCIAGAISLSGAGSVGSAVNAQGNSGTATVSLTGTTNGSIVLNLLGTGTSVTSATSPNTLSWKLNVSSNTNSDNGAMGDQPTSGGTISPAWSVNSDHWNIDAVEIFPSKPFPPFALKAA